MSHQDDEEEDDQYGSFDEGDAVEAARLAAITPVRARLQQRTLFGGLAQVQVSPGAASYSATRGRQRNRDEPLTHHRLDQQALKTWIYPTNYPQRDYQFNMIKKALFTNVLVALPTGLGKTFIAAVVMFNWYRWAPDSKIIFLAPAKPLVTQQIEACYHVCGIPARETAELTGGIDKARRTAAYRERRVFFLTPQTFQNDLRNGLINAREISCLVVDEAHHATGNYAYVNVVNQLRAESESFRILALTATPGKTVETVQEVIDGLNISQIEIRSETSIDIRAYTHTKEVETILIDLSDELVSIQTKFAKLLKPMIQRLSALGVGMTSDPTKVSAFAIREATAKLQRESRVTGRAQNFAVHSISSLLQSLAYNMELLNTHGIKPFYDSMIDLRSNVKTSENKKRLIKDPSFTSMMLEMEQIMKDPEYTGHPKLDHLSGLILNHFQKAEESGDEHTRVMVFSSLRASAEAIVAVLKRHTPLVKPTPFFGQQAGKTGSGMSQKEQQETITKFKKGIYNVIVATSVGEEGLDIGEIDMIICYDSSSSPARMLQRMGRTGRKRDGQVFVLCVRGKEEMAFLKAKDAHKVMQKKIEKGIDIKLSETVHRIIPWNIDPVCEKRLLEVPKDDKISDRELKTAARKKKEAKVFNMPEGVNTGFISAGNLASKRGTKRKRNATVRNIDAQIWDFDSEQDLGLLCRQDAQELDRRFRKLDQDHAGCLILERAELGMFLSVDEIKTPARPVLIGHGRTTRTIRSLLNSRFRKIVLDEAIEKYKKLSMDKPQAQLADEFRKSQSDFVPDSGDDYGTLLGEEDDIVSGTDDSYAALGSFIDDGGALSDPESLDEARQRPDRILKRPPVMPPLTSKSVTKTVDSSFIDMPFESTSSEAEFEDLAEKKRVKIRLSQLEKLSDDEELPDTANALRSAILSSSSKKVPAKKRLKRQRSPSSSSSDVESKSPARKGRKAKTTSHAPQPRSRIRIIPDDEDEEEDSL